MSKLKTCTSSQKFMLIVLPYVAGWYIFYEGIAKVLNPQWPFMSFLQQSEGVLSGMSKWIVSHPDVLSTVDFLNTWGVILIGTSLILGLFAKPASCVGATLVFLYYLNAVPFVGARESLSDGENNLLMNKTLIESVCLCVLALFPTSKEFGLDGLIDQYRNKKITINDNRKQRK